jgi:hypothetical protein
MALFFCKFSIKKSPDRLPGLFLLTNQTLNHEKTKDSLVSTTFEILEESYKKASPKR